MLQPSYRRIYILCPAGTRTGGPEALHQLGRSLLDRGHDARMVYTARELQPARDGSRLSFPNLVDPMPPDYARYGIPVAWSIDDEPANAVVYPELWPDASRHLLGADRYLWWLSIDNALAAVDRFGGFEAIAAARSQHLAQSFYAVAYLAAKGISALPLFDYTSPDYAKAAQDAEIGERIDRVLFQSRSQWFVAHLQKLAPDLQWTKLGGMTATEVQELFLTSKLYVDFGSHPGKDRMPREAAMLGCCVITGRRGAAENPYDIPIPGRYKFKDWRQLNGRRIVVAIRNTLAAYDARRSEFETYRRMIDGERAEFDAQVDRVFGTRVGAAA